MNGASAVWLNAAFARPEHRTEQSRLALKPANPNCRVAAAAGWAMANDQLVVGVANPETEIPTEIFLSRLGIGLHTTLAKLLDEPTRHVVAVAAIVDEVILTLGHRVKRI